jgi:hypothetical protein
MFDMLKTILLDALGFKAAPAAPVAAHPMPVYHAAPTKVLAPEPTGYPVFDSTGIVSVTEDHFGIL